MTTVQRVQERVEGQQVQYIHRVIIDTTQGQAPAIQALGKEKWEATDPAHRQRRGRASCGAETGPDHPEGSKDHASCTGALH